MGGDLREQREDNGGGGGGGSQRECVPEITAVCTGAGFHPMARFLPPTAPSAAHTCCPRARVLAGVRPGTEDRCWPEAAVMFRADLVTAPRRPRPALEADVATGDRFSGSGQPDPVCWRGAGGPVLGSVTCQPFGG